MQWCLMNTRVNFRSAVGVKQAHLCPSPAFAYRKRLPTGVRGKGLRYEVQVTKDLETYENWSGVPGPWFEFESLQGKLSYAQPDWLGFNFHTGVICIAEIKLSRVEKAWWQLNQLYKPLVAAVFPQWDIALLEVASNIRALASDHSIRVAYSLDDVRPGETQFMKVSYRGR